MKFKIGINIIFILTVAILSFPNILFADQFKVTRVYDGDTIKAVGHDIEIKIGLVGIDAPETKKGKRKPGQPFSVKAEKYLVDLVLNKLVDIKGYGLGPYNRILGVVYVADKNINLELIRAGYAEVYRGKPPRGFDLTPYQKAESEAKSTGRGMWYLGDKHVSPKDWKKAHRK